MYAWLVEENRLEEADHVYVQWDTLFIANKVQRHGGTDKKILKERLATGNKALPSKVQLATIDAHSKRLNIEPPQVFTREEAAEVINSLKGQK